MVTQAQAVDWALQQVGKSLDMDGKYGAQCVDLIGYYCKFLANTKWPGTPGAKDIWTANFNADDYDKISRNDPPQPGDVGIWGASPTNQWGHTFIVVGVSGATMDVVDQNYVGYNENGSPAARHPLPINNRLLGFLRPKFVPNAVAPNPGNYTIKSGDTFWGLEQSHGWPSNTLQQLNPGQDPRKLAVGQQIVIPTAPQIPTATHTEQRKHTVVNGENLSVIAAAYGVQNWRQIYDIPENKATIGGNPNVIQPGQVLIIP